MKEFLIVDGYNIIYAWPEFEELKSELDHARSKLISILVNYSPLSGRRVLVVFDAHQVKNFPERTEIVDGVEVIYTQQGETADALIERLVGKLMNEGAVFVATSDWAEQEIIFGKGAYRLTPGELRMEIERIRSEAESMYMKNPPVNGYLENRLVESDRSILEKWRRKKK